MNKQSTNQDGFSAVEVILVIVIVVLIGVVGWLAYKNTHKTTIANTASTTVTNSSNKSTTGSTTTTPKYYLDNNQVSFTLPSDWEVVKSPHSTFCGESVTSNLPKCTSAALLVLKSEGYVNPDQFYANIAVFPIANGTGATDFFQQTGNTGYSGTTSNLTINGNPAFSDVAHPDPSSSEIWLYYAITKGDIGVLVYSDLFSGNHYSFTTNNNYLGYQSEVDTIAKSIIIN